MTLFVLLDHQWRTFDAQPPPHNSAVCTFSEEPPRGPVSVRILSGTSTIDHDAFRGCAQLETVDIPPSVRTIGTGAFRDCGALVAVNVRASTPPTLLSGAFFGTNPDLVIHVPRASLGAYLDSPWWAQVRDHIEATL